MINLRHYSNALNKLCTDKKIQHKIWICKKFKSHFLAVKQRANDKITNPNKLLTRTTVHNLKSGQLFTSNVPKNVALKLIQVKKQSVRRFSKKEDDSNSVDTTKKAKAGLPEAPTNCCMSGCANCVWITYAEQLSEYFKDGGASALKEIEEKVTDPNLKSFILHEWRMKNKKD